MSKKKGKGGDDGKVLPFRPRLVKSEETHVDPQEAKPITIACHCYSTSWELEKGGVVRCARCHCELMARWTWTS